MISEIDHEGRYKLSDDVLFRVIDGEVIIVPVESAAMSAKETALYTLTNSGKLIWNLLDGKNTVQQLIDYVIERYDAPVDQVEGDVLAFLEKLAVRGMITQL